MRLLLAVALLALFPSLSWAHSGPEHLLSFAHGLEHPMGGLDHVLAMVAVGVFAFVLGGRALWMVPLAFVGMMIVGFGAGVVGIPVPFVELGIALSSVLIGGAAALGRPMPVAAAMGLVGVFAVLHGHAHGAEMPADASSLGYAAGFVLATAGLHLCGAGGSMAVARLIGRLGSASSRVAGGGLALAGVGVLAGWL